MVEETRKPLLPVQTLSPHSLLSWKFWCCSVVVGGAFERERSAVGLPVLSCGWMIGRTPNICCCRLQVLADARCNAIMSDVFWLSLSGERGTERYAPTPPMSDIAKPSPCVPASME